MCGIILFKQESPPAWTQEAYRPPCSEYSFCCPTRVPPPGGGTWPGYPPPPPRGGGGGGTGPGSPPGGGTWPGYPPQGGVPDPGTPPWGGTRSGYPPGGGGGVPDPGTPPPPPGGYLTRVPPPPPGVGGGYLTRVFPPSPPGVDRQTKWNYYLPVVLRTRAVKIYPRSTCYMELFWCIIVFSDIEWWKQFHVWIYFLYLLFYIHS